MAIEPSLYLIRHGDTDLNGGDGEEKFRSWSDIPLNADGMSAAKVAGKVLLGHLIEENEAFIYRVVSSPLQRTVMTGHIIADTLSVTLRTDRGLLPWNLGIFQGKSVDKNKDQVTFYQHHPDMAVPDGESYREFFERYSAALRKLLHWVEKNPDKPLAVITHSRNLLAIPTIIGNKKIGTVPVKGGPTPAEVLCLELEDGKWKLEKID